MSMSLVEARRLSINSVFPEWFYSTVRPTVQVVICTDEGKLFLVRSALAPDTDGWFIPLQGGIDKGETIGEAFLRELKEEAGVVLPPSVLDGAKILNLFDNPMDPKRGYYKGDIPKRIVSVGLRLSELGQVNLNRFELSAHTFASSWDELNCCMSDYVAKGRMQKVEQTGVAVSTACMCNILNWNIPPEVLRKGRTTVH